MYKQLPIFKADQTQKNELQAFWRNFERGHLSDSISGGKVQSSLFNETVQLNFNKTPNVYTEYYSWGHSISPPNEIHYHMASSMTGQDEPNPVLLLATLVGKMEQYCLFCSCNNISLKSKQVHEYDWVQNIFSNS